MEQIRTMLIDFLREYYLFVLASIALLSFMHWSRLKNSGPQLLKFVRKLSLFVFSVALFVPYIKITSSINSYLVTTYNLNYRFSGLINEYKGSDWADGILTSASFFVYLGIIVYLWILEKKASVPPPDKPLKFEAKIGNIDPPK